MCIQQDHPRRHDHLVLSFFTIQHPESVIIIFSVIVSLLLVVIIIIIITTTITTTSYVVSVLFHNLSVQLLLLLLRPILPLLRLLLLLLLLLLLPAGRPIPRFRAFLALPWLRFTNSATALPGQELDASPFSHDPRAAVESCWKNKLIDCFITLNPDRFRQIHAKGITWLVEFEMICANIKLGGLPLRHTF